MATGLPARRRARAINRLLRGSLRRGACLRSLVLALAVSPRSGGLCRLLLALIVLLSFCLLFLVLFLVLILPRLFLALLALLAAAFTLALALPLAILALLALASTLALPFAARGSLATHCGECTHGLNVLGLRHALFVDLAGEGDQRAHSHVSYLCFVQEDVAVVLCVGVSTLDETEALLRVEGFDPALELARLGLAHLLLPCHPGVLHKGHHGRESEAWPGIAHPGRRRHGVLWL
mmetsp:Transcript_89934/g.226154  ORF Transcript_89934/g.226154 Transcript_89934/m.226154 type:complete len:236 (+) Transcript_89934:406-1113(+)